MRRRRLLLGCFVASVAIHLAFAARLDLSEETAERSASPGGEVSVVGSIADMVAGIETPDPVEPLPEIAVEPTEVAPPVQVAARQAETVPPVEAVPPRPTEPPPVEAEIPPAVEPDTPTPVESARPDAIEPQARIALDPVLRESRDPVVPVPAATPDDTAEPVTSEISPPVTAAAPPLETQPKSQPEEVRPVETQTLAAVQPTPPAEAAPPVAAPVTPLATVEAVRPDTVIAAIEAPLPTAKPKIERPQRRAIAKKPVRRKTRAARGNARENAARGGETRTSDSGRARAVGRDTGRKGDGGRAAISNYQGRVLARLQRAKRYPAAARRQRIEGTVVLRFTVSRSGAVGGARIVRSSGQPQLDSAVMAMIRRASPMPRFPSEIARNSLTFTVPIRFSAR